MSSGGRGSAQELVEGTAYKSQRKKEVDPGGSARTGGGPPTIPSVPPREHFAHQIHGFLPGADAAFQLGVFQGVQHERKLRPGLVAHGNEVGPRHQGFGPQVLGAVLLELFPGQIVVVEPLVAAGGVQTVQFEVLDNYDLARKKFEEY